MLYRFFFLIGSFFILGCSRNYFYVQQEKIDKNFLASTHVHTPDPRQENPPEGSALLISWDFPLSVFEKKLTLVSAVRFWDTEEEIVTRPILRKRDSCFLFFSNRKILTYLVRAISSTGEVEGEWEHHFWTEWIDIDREDSRESAQRRSDSVSSQLRQESVIETP